jgi:tetratricopeptide (TPR) repeat protein
LKVFPKAEDEMPVPNPVAVRVDRYLEQGGDSFKMIKAADLVVRRNPEDIEAWLTLAAVVGLPDERDYLYQEAVSAGRKVRNRKLAEGKATGWEDPETCLYAHALLANGRALALCGGWEAALACVRELLEIDPTDRIGAEDLAREVGLISPADEEAGMAMCM